MSKEYPCIYFRPGTGGLCSYGGDLSEANICVFGPCENETPSNGDRIRAMSDEELAKWFLIVGICIRDFEDCKCDGVSCRQCRMNWLQQPAEEDIP